MSWRESVGVNLSNNESKLKLQLRLDSFYARVEVKGYS